VSAERRRFVVGAVVVMLTVVVLGIATLGGRDDQGAVAPTSAPARPHVLALGDSVAAGFGLERTKDAYPAIVAARTRRTVEQLATPGACAVRSGATCTGSVLHDQLPRADSRARPDVVTLTVGANDIGFAQCFAALFGLDAEPCEGARYERALSTLAADLDTLLAALARRFPDARVVLTSYFDPLPTRADDLCGLADAEFSEGGLTERSARRLAKRLFDERIEDVEQGVYDRTAAGLAALNATITRVAGAHDAAVATVDFTSHDACASTPWVFAPDVDATIRFRWPGPDYDEHVRSRARTRCTEPCGPPIPFSTEYDTSVGTLEVEGVVTPNGTPHPNALGHRAIAVAVLAALRTS
jgi:lysophospholipase L1-like esterase